ncbi:MAG TPA: hypothetical protein VGE63_02505 [Candidatus Paceibacterota bacterium]
MATQSIKTEFTRSVPILLSNDYLSIKELEKFFTDGKIVWVHSGLRLLLEILFKKEYPLPSHLNNESRHWHTNNSRAPDRLIYPQIGEVSYDVFQEYGWRELMTRLFFLRQAIEKQINGNPGELLVNKQGNITQHNIILRIKLNRGQPLTLEVRWSTEEKKWLLYSWLPRIWEAETQILSSHVDLR